MSTLTFKNEAPRAGLHFTSRVEPPLIWIFNLFNLYSKLLKNNILLFDNSRNSWKIENYWPFLSYDHSVNCAILEFFNFYSQNMSSFNSPFFLSTFSVTLLFVILLFHAFLSASSSRIFFFFHLPCYYLKKKKKMDDSIALSWIRM